MATTEINFREIFATQTIENLKSGSYRFVRFAREQEVVTISEAKGKRAIAYCEALKATPVLGGEEAAITGLYILGHKLMEANDWRLPNAAAITSATFKGLEEADKGSTEYKAVESALVGALVKELSKFALGSAHAKALRTQYAKQLLSKGFGNDADDDKDMDDDLKARLRGNDASKADRLSKQATKPMTYVFAEIFSELEVEWKLRMHFHRLDTERKAKEDAMRDNDRKITHSMGNLLGGLGVANMGKDNDGNGRKTRPAAEPVLSEQETQQVSNLLGGLGKPALKRKSSRSVESV